jgi:hypothetical protein
MLMRENASVFRVMRRKLTDTELMVVEGTLRTGSGSFHPAPLICPPPAIAIHCRP